MNRDVPPSMIAALDLVERLRIVADAELVHGLSGTVSISGSRQKLVLMHLTILEGQRVALQAIADRCCISLGSAWHAVQALNGAGLLAIEGAKRRSKVYRVNVRRLRKSKCATPYFVPRGKYKRQGEAA